jgi:hypothetical protein
LVNLHNYNEFEKSLNTFTVKKDEEGDINLVIPTMNSKQKKREERKQVNQEKRRLTILSNCARCYGAKLSEYSVICESQNIYLAYPYLSGSITDFHLILSSKEHVNSSASIEENVYDEVRNFMKSIVACNIEKDYSTIFIEFALTANSVSHFEIECIPIKHKLLEDARLYFKKAFMDQDYEWSTNKNLVDTTPYKGNLTKILSENFAYVNVDFNAQGGFLHPIEDASRFSQTFLREILCPVLKKQVHEVKYPKKLGVKELVDVVEEYKKRFDAYNWTKY